MGRAESIGALEVSKEACPYESEADIENCFYQCGIPEDWSEYLTFPDCLSLEECKFLGLTHFLGGAPIGPSSRVFLGLTVLPMGFSWSFWIVQQIHQDLIAKAGFPGDRCIVGAWPPPKLEDGPVALPYCDNLTIFALSEQEANDGLKRTMK
eukprot:5728577-Karenia_brevis.AAC.1